MEAFLSELDDDWNFGGSNDSTKKSEEPSVSRPDNVAQVSASSTELSAVDVAPTPRRFFRRFADAQRDPNTCTESTTASPNLATVAATTGASNTISVRRDASANNEQATLKKSKKTSTSAEVQQVTAASHRLPLPPPAAVCFRDGSPAPPALVAACKKGSWWVDSFLEAWPKDASKTQSRPFRIDSMCSGLGSESWAAKARP
jgi:hypothetical protein